MKNIARKTAVVGAVLVAGFGLTACETDSADVVSQNLSKDADNFKIERRVVFVNGITDKYLLSIEGRCSLADQGTQLEVTCKVGEDAYKKHFLGLSDNVTYFSEQVDTADASEYHYKVVLRPESIIPMVDVETSVTDGEG